MNVSLIGVLIFCLGFTQGIGTELVEDEESLNPPAVLLTENNATKSESTLGDEISLLNTTEAANSSANSTLMDDSSADLKSNSTFKVSCLMNNTGFVPVVEIVNSSKLQVLMEPQANVTLHQTPATCLVVFFYSPSCPFSCLAAPHFNALPRVFPDIRMTALDTSTRYNFNAQYGIVGLPSLLLFHNGRPAARFNSSSDFTLEEFAKFITNNTGLTPEGKLFVTSVDFTGPISSVPVKQMDYCLIMSWLFIVACCLYFFYYSSWCQWLLDAVRSAWREAEAQHQHVE